MNAPSEYFLLDRHSESFPFYRAEKSASNDIHKIRGEMQAKIDKVKKELEKCERDKQTAIMEIATSKGKVKVRDHSNFLAISAIGITFPITHFSLCRRESLILTDERFFLDVNAK